MGLGFNIHGHLSQVARGGLLGIADWCSDSSDQLDRVFQVQQGLDILMPVVPRRNRREQPAVTSAYPIWITRVNVDYAVGVFGGDQTQQPLDEPAVGIKYGNAVAIAGVAQDHVFHGGRLAFSGSPDDMQVFESRFVRDAHGQIGAGVRTDADRRASEEGLHGWQSL